MIESIGLILTPLAIMGIAVFYLSTAFSHEEYIQERGCKEYLRTYPNEKFCPEDTTFWALKAIERERKLYQRNKKEGRKRR